MEALINKLNSLKTASKEAISLLEGLFFKTVFKKGSSLGSSPMRTSPMLHYVHNGLARGTVSYNGNTYILWLMEKGFLVPSNGFLAENGVTETVEFIRDSTVYSLDLYAAARLAKSNSGMYKMLLEIYEQSLIEGRKRELMLRLDISAERMEYVEEIQGNFIYGTDRNTVASYLNISIRQLNRLKGGK